MRIDNFKDLCLASTDLEKKAKVACYKGLAKVEAKYPNAVRVIGPIVGAASFLATIVARVAAVAEIAFLSLLFMVTAPCSDKKGQFLVGLLFLTVGTVGIGLVAGVSAIAKSAYGIFEKTYKLGFKKPEEKYFSNLASIAEEQKYLFRK